LKKTGGLKMRKSEQKNGDKMLKIVYFCEECGTENFDIEAYLADLLHDEIGLGGGN
jgi:hypothetical protein